MAQVDTAVLQQLVKEGYLTCRPHPTANLVIWNYTPKTMYSSHWTPETRMCRGLITTREGSVVAKPFPKFMNLEEYQGEIPAEPFKVTEKVDGSLGVSYLLDGVPYLATRGSFTSEQAERGTAILHKKYKDFLPHFVATHYYTYLFEIIFKENQIVVDYGDMEDLVLLAVINTETGEEYDIHNPIWVAMWPFPIVTHYDGVEDIALLRQREEANKEGFVLHFESGLRLKVKLAEYVRLHRIITQTSSKTIWELLKEGKSLKELYDRVPPEFSTWAKSVSRRLSDEYRRIYTETHRIYKDVTESTSIPLFIPVGPSVSVKQMIILSDVLQRWIQRQFSEYGELEYFLLFLYNHRGKQAKVEFSQAIWKSLEPEYERPFCGEDETEFEEEIREEEVLV